MGTIFNNQGGERTLWHYFIKPRMADPVFRQSVWDEVITNAERHNNPGTFTASIVYEWTSDHKYRVPGKRPGKGHRLHEGADLQGP